MSSLVAKPIKILGETMNKEVKISVEDTVMQIVSEPHILFRVVKGLQMQGRTVRVSYFDEEIDDWTCFQELNAPANVAAR